MADAKKPKPVSAEYQTDSKTVGQIAELLALFLLLGAIASAVTNFINNFGLEASGATFWSRAVAYFFQHIWPIWKLLAVIISSLSFVGIIYNSWKLGGIEAEESLIFKSPVGAGAGGEAEPEPKNKRWEQIIKFANSDNPSDWRQAIIEADVMLEDLLRNLGYMGESVGEMLKAVEKSDFLTIEDAWEAHKLRNAIAHSGGDYGLNSHETKRVIALFEKVFTEFEVI